MRTEIVAFAVIAAFVLAATLVVRVPQQHQQPQQPETSLASSLPNLGKAPDFVGIVAWINSEPLNMFDFRGNVVLVDFWTYDCINCIHTLPYLVNWYAQYASKGLVIVGVHSPEFDFEKSYDNVKAAVAQYGIRYPVALDSNHATWNAYMNSYWPRMYLVDANGDIRYDHIGEGSYNETESAIKALLTGPGENYQGGVPDASTDAVKAEEGAPGTNLGPVPTHSPGLINSQAARVTLGNLTLTRPAFVTAPLMGSLLVKDSSTIVKGNS